jgi:predicted metal-dependent peptidase
LGGGKGTNFNPVFDYIDAQDSACDVVIYFTDAKGVNCHDNINLMGFKRR